MPDDQSMRTPRLTVGIPAFDTWDKLERLLGNLAAQETEILFEVLVVDDAHPSNLAEQVRRHFPTVKVYRNIHNRGPAFGRNLIFCEARGDYVAFLDADCELPVTWVESIGAVLAPGILISGRVDRPDGSLEWGPRRSTLIGVSRRCAPERADVASSNNMVVDRRLAQAIGGFNERLKIYFEDSLFSLEAKRLGAKFRYLETIAVTHHHHSLLKPGRLRLQSRNTLWSMYHFHRKRPVVRWFSMVALTTLYSGRVLQNLWLGRPAFAVAYLQGMTDAAGFVLRESWHQQWLDEAQCVRRRQDVE